MFDVTKYEPEAAPDFRGLSAREMLESGIAIRALLAEMREERDGNATRPVKAPGEKTPRTMGPEYGHFLEIPKAPVRTTPRTMGPSVAGAMGAIPFPGEV